VTHPQHLLHAFSTFDMGGITARFVQLVDRFGDRFRHTIMAMDGMYGAIESIRNRSLVQVLELPVKKGWTLANVPLFVRTLADLEPARVVSYNWGAIEWAFAAGLRRLPHVHVEEGFGAEEVERRLLRRSVTRLVALHFSRAELVTVSATMREIALREWRIPKRRCTLIPNGVDPHGYGFRPERLGPSKYARTDDEVVVGTVAKLRAEKRVDRLIEAIAIAARTCKLRLVVVGDGPESAALAARVAELGIGASCLFLGMRRDLQEILPELDIFALSSDTEQMPIAILEAMAAGLPIVSTDVGDVRAMLPAGSSELIVRRDAAELATALVKLAREKVLRMEIGLKNRAHVETRYRDTLMCQQWEQVYAGEDRTNAPQKDT